MRIMKTKKLYKSITSIVVLVILQLVFTLIAFGEANTIIPQGLNLNKLTGIISVDFKSDSESAQNIKSGINVKLSGTDLSATTDSRGYFEIYSVPKNDIGYSISISKPGFLARDIKITNDLAATQISPIVMWAGDLPSKGSQDNTINMADIMEMAKSFNASSEDTNYNTYKDFNQDKAINMADVIIIAKHFNTTSEDYPSIEPSIVSKIEIAYQNRISLIFSKNIQLENEYIEDLSHYTITKDDGKIISISNANYTATNNTLFLTLKDKQYGKYTIYIAGLKDLMGKEVQPLLNAITFYDMTAPTVENIYYSDSAKNKILVEFNEEMQTEGRYSVLLPENYKWDNNANGTSFELLPEGSTIAVSPVDNRAIVITLGQGNEVTPNTIVKFGYIQDSVIKILADKEGNFLNPGYTQKVVLESKPSIAYQNLSITSGSTIKVHITGSKLIKVSPEDFKYTLTGDPNYYVTPLSAKLLDIENKQYIEFTVPNDTFTVYTDLSKVTLKTTANPKGSISIFGSTISDSATSAVVSESSLRPSIKSISIYDYSNIVVKLEGNINSTELTNFISSVQLFQGTYPIGLANASLIGSTRCSNTIMLTTKTPIDILGSVTLKTLPLSFIVARDFNGQYFNENTLGVFGSAVFMAGKLSTTGTPEQIVKNGDVITIDLNMVPKDVTTAKLETNASGKTNVKIECVGTITGFKSISNAVKVEVANIGKQILVTFSVLSVDTDLSYSSDDPIKFIPDPSFVNVANAPIDVEVTPSL